VSVILRAALERTRRGLTQPELARRLGVDQKRLSETERGLRHEPTLRAMERFFGMKRELLLRPVPASLNPSAPTPAAQQFGPLDVPSPRRASASEVPPAPDMRIEILKRGQ
jgi:transcriptional regulator with XRE-family HTH domain